jgi:hypothetical protein
VNRRPHGKIHSDRDTEVEAFPGLGVFPSSGKQAGSHEDSNAEKEVRTRKGREFGIELELVKAVYFVGECATYAPAEPMPESKRNVVCHCIYRTIIEPLPIDIVGHLGVGTEQQKGRLTIV